MSVSIDPDKYYTKEVIDEIPKSVFGLSISEIPSRKNKGGYDNVCEAENVLMS